MINNKRVLAIIPARGGSKGLPGKNIRLLDGLPLVTWPIKAALNSRYVDRVIVTTDDQNIAKIAQEHGADVPFLRPAVLADDSSPSSDAIVHAIEFCAALADCYDYIVLLEPTSPLTEQLDIDQALEQLVAEQRAMAIVGASAVESAHPLYCATRGSNGLLKPLFRDSFAEPVRRQDLDEVLFFDGSLYISDVNHYLKMRTFYHEFTIPYIVPAWKSLEIDTLLDFLLVETIVKNKNLLMAS